MKHYRLTYFLGQSLKGLWRNGIMSVASVTVLMGCLVVMGTFATLILNINTNLEQLGLLNEIVVFVELDSDGESQAEKVGLVGSSEEKSDAAAADAAGTEGTDAETEEYDEFAEVILTREEELARIEAEIRALSNVSEVTLVTKEQALAEEREKYKEHAELYDLVEDDNPLRDSFVIKYSDTSEVATLKTHIGRIDGIVKINDRQDLAQSIDKVKGSVSMILLWFMAILFVVSIFVIINTIKLALHSRRSEITIMRYIGATDWFIMLPFLLEGVLIGILSSGFAFLIQWYIYGYVFKMTDEGMSFIKILEFNEIAPTLGMAFLGIGVVTGIIGSIISTRKYLKA